MKQKDLLADLASIPPINQTATLMNHLGNLGDPDLLGKFTSQLDEETIEFPTLAQIDSSDNLQVIFQAFPAKGNFAFKLFENRTCNKVVISEIKIISVSFFD